MRSKCSSPILLVIKFFFMSRWLLRIAYALTLLLLILTPWHGLLSTFFLYGLDLKATVFAPWISAWKEVSILLLMGIALFFLLQKKVRLRKLHYLILAFILLGCGVSFFHIGTLTPSHWVWGGRTEFIFLIALIALTLLTPLWTELQKKRLIQAFIGNTLLVLCFAGILGLVGHDQLTALGYREDWSTFYLEEAPAYCQKEANTEFCRFQAGFTGPNRLAGFLLIALPALSLIQRPLWKWLSLGLGVLILGFTFSASAWLAALGMAFVALFIRWRTLGFAIAGLGILGAIGTFIFYPEILSTPSETEHLQRFLEGLRRISEAPFGYGLGSSGPASYRTDSPFIPESWYLQVAINLGLAGLFLFLIIWGELFSKLCRKPTALQWAAGLALLGVLIQNAFLHTFEDAGVYFPLMLLLALALTAKQEWLKET